MKRILLLLLLPLLVCTGGCSRQHKFVIINRFNENVVLLLFGEKVGAVIPANGSTVASAYIGGAQSIDLDWQASSGKIILHQSFNRKELDAKAIADFTILIDSGPVRK